MEIDHESLVRDIRRRGRGARSNVSGRYEGELREAVDDGWETLHSLPVIKTDVQIEMARSIVTTNTSPDLLFDQSINPYRGCEHGCSYCYARPNHTYVGLSAGLDFETRLFAKTNAADLLRKELARPGYVPKTIALGAVTDPYQPIERTYGISRAILNVLDEASHPVAIVTKSAGVIRDLDVLARMAERGLVKVALSITSLDRSVARKMEPRAATPQRRLDAIRELSDSGVPATVMTAPIIPSLNDWEIERILDASHGAGAREAGYVLLRLPHEIKQLFREWLVTEFPDRADRVINLLREMRGGKDYDARWGVRQTGQGAYAMQIKARYKLALKRIGMNDRRLSLRTDLFEPPVLEGGQMRLL